MTPWGLGAIALLGAAACGGGARPETAAQPTAARPALVVLITVDQMRADYLDRFGAQLHGGLGRLASGGARFTNAHQDHAITETAPGHASLLSGRFPRSTGITSNGSGVRDDSVTLLGGAPGTGASPHRFHGTTLADWMHARDRRTRTLSVSAKDRAAILPVGRARLPVYWYTPDGRFTTSTYYADSLPDWVQRFNDRHTAQRRAGHVWALLLPDSAYAERDSVSIEGAGHDFLFPHPIPADSTAAADYVRVTPCIDEIVLAFALDGVQALALGDGSRADLLNISLSGTDYIGHRYGPDSREMHDQMLRLDRALGAFLDSLYRMRDSSRVDVVLTADHGVATIPELAPAGTTPLPVRVELYTVQAAMRQGLRAVNADTNAIVVDGQLVAVDRAALARAHLSADSLLDVFASEARRTPGVLRVDRFRDLLAADPSRDAIARRWTHQFPPNVAVDLVVTLAPGSVWEGDIAAHGSPHDYDTHVPLIFYGPAFRPGRYDEFVRTVDLAPTLARVVGVKPLEALDGVPLGRALR